MAYYVWTDSLQNPEPTEWDDDETKNMKLQRTATAKRGQR